MIVKKIGRSRKGTAGSLKAYARTLASYITRAEEADLRKLAEMTTDSAASDLLKYVTRENSQEHIRLSGAENLVGKGPGEWSTELELLLHRARGRGEPIDHWVLSFADGEDPSDEDLHKITKRFLELVGADDLPAVWAGHADTDNTHVHILLARIRPTDGQVVRIGGGWSIDTAHRAKAVIEEEFALSSESGSKYVVEASELKDRRTGDTIGFVSDPATFRLAVQSRRAGESRGLKLDEASRRFEQDTGLWSLARTVQTFVPPALKAASDWDEFHEKLAAKGISLEKKGSGAVFRAGELAVKASIVRSASLGKLEERFGPFRAARDLSVLAPYRYRDVQTDKVASEAFTMERTAHQSSLSAVRSLLTADLAAGKGAARAEIGRLAEFKFPTYQQWLAGQRANVPSDLFAEVSGRFLAIEGPTNPAQALRRCPPGYLAMTRGQQVVFRDRRTGKRAFTQAGSFVVFHRRPDEHTIRAVLTLLAREKDAPLRAWGSAAFKKKVAAEAIAQGLTLATTGAGAFSEKLLSELNVTPPPPSREVHEQAITPKPSIGAERSRGKTPVHRVDVDKQIPSSPNANSSEHTSRRDSELASKSPEPAQKHQATLANLVVQWEQFGPATENQGKRRMLAVQIVKLAQETGTAIPAEHQKEIQKQVLEQRRMQQAAAQLRGQSR